jgi:hypothetical protein
MQVAHNWLENNLEKDDCSHYFSSVPLLVITGIYSFRKDKMWLKT